MKSSSKPGEHGVLVQVFNKGVWLRGQSGVGKSDCALQLLWRGHKLVADDLILLEAQNNQLIGSAPKESFALLFIRELGLIDIETLMGANSVLPQCKIDLIINLSDGQMDIANTSFPKNMFVKEHILGVSILKLNLSSSSKRDMAILIETAVKLAFSPQSQRVLCLETNNC